MPNISKTLFASLLLSFLLIYLAADADEMVIRTNIDSPPPETGIGGAPPPPPPQPIDCDVRCEERCKLSSRQRLCKRACGTCCDRCGCVPPGTAGNYDTCPCYANMTTHGGRRKCP